MKTDNIKAPLALHLLGLCLLLNGISIGQKSNPDKPEIQKNFVFVEPTSIFGDLGLDLNNFWLVSGYQRSFGIRNFVGLKFGLIVKSLVTSSDLLSPLDALHTAGMNISLEHKYLIKSKFYYATSLEYQYTNTIREEIIYLEDNSYKSHYNVGRFVYGLIPKVGFQFVTKKHFYCDVSLGIGVRFISSYNSGKKDLSQNFEREVISNKIFDFGYKWAPRIPFQLKLGYTF